MSRKRSLLLAGLVATAAALAPSAALGGAISAGSHTVVIKETRFRPGGLTIRRGDSVTWVWRDGGTEHNVTAHSFHSRTMGHGSYTVHFTRSGTFNYRCTIHESEGMRGRIVVH
jgi:plastocyanin